ncbi:MAG: hypothetical protein M3Q06_06630 [Bacteroidota bacterium]|nr:hypothetical protein [Bacteroidota bacterium]
MKHSQETAPAVSQKKALSVMLLGFASTLVLSSVVVTYVIKWLSHS